MKQIIIFDNHKIPSKLRGKPLILEKGAYIKIGQYSSSNDNPHMKKWEYASSGDNSKTGRHLIKLKKHSKLIYLKPSEYSLVSLNSDRSVNK